MKERKVDRQVWKYTEEDYPISVNFAKRVRTGQVIESVVITAVDVQDNDVTDELIEEDNEISGSTVIFSWKAGGGEIGKRYYISVIALTEDDTLGYHLELTVQ